MKAICIEIDHEGDTSVETEGFTGKSGRAVRDAICKALGQTNVVTKRKAGTRVRVGVAVI